MKALATILSLFFLVFGLLVVPEAAAAADQNLPAHANVNDKGDDGEGENDDDSDGESDGETEGEDDDSDGENDGETEGETEGEDDDSDGENDGETEGEDDDSDGENDGETEGETEGEDDDSDGENDGETEGEDDDSDGENDGETEGEDDDSDGENDGETEGEDDDSDGENDGETEGEDDDSDGENDGETEGEDDDSDGENDGETEGEDDGETEGEDDGETEGEDDGETEGEDDGETEGEDDGETEGEDEGEDDNLVFFGFDEEAFQVVEDDGVAHVTVEISGDPTGIVMVDYSAVSGSATAGDDFVETSGTLVFDPADPEEMTFEVTIVDDGDEEGNESILLILSNPIGEAEVDAEDWMAELVILDNEGAYSCFEDHNTLCFQDSRFAIEIDWQALDGSTGSGQAVPLSNSTGLFWFFSDDNFEVMLKVLDGCRVTGLEAYWIFFAALTNVEYTLTVTDTVTGTVKEYHNPKGRAAQPVQDLTTFDACP